MLPTGMMTFVSRGWALCIELEGKDTNKGICCLRFLRMSSSMSIFFIPGKLVLCVRCCLNVFALLDDQPSGLDHLHSVGSAIVIMVKDISILDIKLVHHQDSQQIYHMNMVPAANQSIYIDITNIALKRVLA